jgi:hypothetical protein
MHMFPQDGGISVVQWCSSRSKWSRDSQKVKYDDAIEGKATFPRKDDFVGKKRSLSDTVNYAVNAAVFTLSSCSTQNLDDIWGIGERKEEISAQQYLWKAFNSKESTSSQSHSFLFVHWNGWIEWLSNETIPLTSFGNSIVNFHPLDPLKKRETGHQFVGRPFIQDGESSARPSASKSPSLESLPHSKVWFVYRQSNFSLCVSRIRTRLGCVFLQFVHSTVLVREAIPCVISLVLKEDHRECCVAFRRFGSCKSHHITFIDLNTKPKPFERLIASFTFVVFSGIDSTTFASVYITLSFRFERDNTMSRFHRLTFSRLCDR